MQNISFFVFFKVDSLGRFAVKFCNSDRERVTSLNARTSGIALLRISLINEPLAFANAYMLKV